jgi:dihydrofolate reductase
MRKVIVNEFMSLDGVAQAPGAADEDTTGGFEHGGWHLRYFDDLSQKWVLENLTEAGGFLLGRRTYEIFAAYCDVAEAVAALKQEDGGDLLVIGSTELVKTLIKHDLVDEFRVMIDPLVVGGGKRIFRDDGALRPLRLVDGEVTTTGAILATYAPEEV